ncbi:MAG: hypothetical protein NTW21_23480 [Verrucomicrobia bacterium]|nr:hypothetical protein [Verrucomicrobiota bacterium]
MNLLPFLSASAVLGLVACDSMNAPFSSSDFNPLLPPGSGIKMPGTQPSFRPGDHVRATMDKTAFFEQLPKGDADADKTLIRDTRMKVLRVAGSYLQVELDTTGEVGYVPSVMVENPSAPPPTLPGSPDGLQYPLPPGTVPVPPLPAVDPSQLPPDGAIPTVIDPEAPAPPTPPTPAVPAPTPTPDPTPSVEPKVEAPE